MILHNIVNIVLLIACVIAIWLIVLSQVRPYLAATPRSKPLALDLGAGRGVLAHSGRCFSTPWRAPERDVALAGIGVANDFPIARRLMVCRESKHRFE